MQGFFACWNACDEQIVFTGDYQMTWKAGQSGNPKGRPKGSRDRYVVYREGIEHRIDGIIQKVAQLAEEGDLAACRLLLERIWPSDAESQIEMREQFDALNARLDKLEKKS